MRRSLPSSLFAAALVHLAGGENAGALKPRHHGHYMEFVLIIALFSGKCAGIFLFHAIFPKRESLLLRRDLMGGTPQYENQGRPLLIRKSAMPGGFALVSNFV